MNAKHTPGPWNIFRREQGRGYAVYATDDELRYVAICQDLPAHDDHQPTNDKANAQLIAASPRMLAFIETFLSTATIETPQELIAEAEAITEEVRK
jgi:hypothetical protein